MEGKVMQSFRLTPKEIQKIKRVARLFGTNKTKAIQLMIRSFSGYVGEVTLKS